MDFLGVLLEHTASSSSAERKVAKDTSTWTCEEFGIPRSFFNWSVRFKDQNESDASLRLCELYSRQDFIWSVPQHRFWRNVTLEYVLVKRLRLYTLYIVHITGISCAVQQSYLKHHYFRVSPHKAFDFFPDAEDAVLSYLKDRHFGAVPQLFASMRACEYYTKGVCSTIVFEGSSLWSLAWDH
jgi:hypothetical protein